MPRPFRCYLLGLFKKLNHRPMRKLFFIICGLLFTCYCLPQRYDSKRLYDFGLPDSKEISHTLPIAIVCLIVGFIICWVTMWRKSPEEKANPDKISYIGCGGCLIMIVGVLFLLPLLAYVELIGQALFFLVLVIVGIVAAFFFFKDKLK